MLVKHYTCILYITICVSFQTCLLIVPAALGTPGSPTNIGTTHARQRWQTLQATFFGGVQRRQRKALEATNFGNCYFRHLSLLSFFLGLSPWRVSFLRLKFWYLSFRRWSLVDKQTFISRYCTKYSRVGWLWTSARYFKFNMWCYSQLGPKQWILKKIEFGPKRPED